MLQKVNEVMTYVVESVKYSVIKGVKLDLGGNESIIRS